MDISDALTELGAHDGLLTADELRHLDDHGYVPFPGVLAPEEVHALTHRLTELARAEGSSAGHEVHQEAGTDRLANLVEKDALFWRCVREPRVLAAVAHVLGGDVKLSALNSRAALPGQGHQGLHADGDGLPPAGGRYTYANSIWLLDDFTPDNGATRVVPGSHRFGVAVADVMGDPAQPHPAEVKIVGMAGTVVVFNSHLWHGGTTNRTTSPRRALTAFYCRRAASQQLDQKRFLSEQTVQALGPAMRCLLDV